MASATQEKEVYAKVPTDEPKYHRADPPSSLSDKDIEKQQPSTTPVVYGTFQKYRYSYSKEVEKRGHAASILLSLAASVLMVGTITTWAYIIVLMFVG